MPIYYKTEHPKIYHKSLVITHALIECETIRSVSIEMSPKLHKALQVKGNKIRFLNFWNFFLLYLSLAWKKVTFSANLLIYACQTHILVYSAAHYNQKSPCKILALLVNDFLKKIWKSAKNTQNVHAIHA